MATISNFYRFHFRLFIILSLIAFGQTVNAQTKKPALAALANPPRPALVFADEAQLRQAVFDSASRFVGKTEKTGRNDGAWITSINRFNGLPKNAHYCASAFYYCHVINGVKIPVRSLGLVRSYFCEPGRLIYKRNQRGNQRIGRKVQLMDAVSLFASHIEGVAQLRYDPEIDDRVRCIGFNTSGGRGTKDGCYINWRKTSEIKAIANWISPYWKSLKPKAI